MDSSVLNIEVSDFRSIRSADIDLDGITVVAGVNGCGKSSLSRLLYDTMKISLDYDKYVRAHLNKELDAIRRAISEGAREIGRSPLFSILDANSSEPWSNLTNIRNSRIKDYDGFADYCDRLTSVTSSLRDFILTKTTQQNDLFAEEVVSARYNRILRLISNAIDRESSNANFNVDDIAELFSELNKKIEDEVLGAELLCKQRPILPFMRELSSAFSQNMVGVDFNIHEMGAPLIDRHDLEGVINTPNIIQNCIYINTPWVLDIFIPDSHYWHDLQLLLNSRKTAFNINSEVDLVYQQISGKNAISGQVEFLSEGYNDRFIYKRSDGVTFNLEECATGIKSFGILQVLLRNGLLNKDTLLILDEPEAHLHPQWIVEYARVLVLLRKHLGVRCFIASHNPDMISAIRYISEKEGILSNTKFYLAENNDGYQFDYTPLGDDIDKIFDSFNMAYSRIALYSEETPSQDDE